MPISHHQVSLVNADFLRDRSRSVKLRVLDINRAARSKATASLHKLTRAYRQLLNSTSRVVGQAKRWSRR
jgi:IS5 family transposase